MQASTDTKQRDPTSHRFGDQAARFLKETRGRIPRFLSGATADGATLDAWREKIAGFIVALGERQNEIAVLIRVARLTRLSSLDQVEHFPGSNVVEHEVCAVIVLPCR